MDEKEITEIVIRRGWRKLGIAKVPSWVDTLNQEGIEFVQGKIKNFWVKDSEKVFGEPPSDQVQKLIDELTKKPFEAPQGTNKDVDSTKLPEKKNIASTDVSDAILPDIFSPALLEKWRKMKNALLVHYVNP